MTFFWENEPTRYDFFKVILEILRQNCLTPYPQLITSLCRYPPNMTDENADRRVNRITKIICNVGKKYTQAVYLPMRTQYLTLKMEDKRNNAQEPESKNSKMLKSKMKRCSAIMGMLRDEFPPILTSVEDIIELLLRSLKENWYEKLLREMRSLVVRLQNLQFANTTPRLEPNSEQDYDDFATHLRRVAENFAKETKTDDPVLDRLKEEFPRDLQPETFLDGQLVNSESFEPLRVKVDEFNQLIGPLLIPKMKKWIKRLEQKVKSGRNYTILSESKFLDDDVEVPGESMEPRDPKNFVKLAKVLPIVNIIDRYDSIGKEIQFLGTNGRVYPYLFTSQEQRQGLLP